MAGYADLMKNACGRCGPRVQRLIIAIERIAVTIGYCNPSTEMLRAVSIDAMREVREIQAEIAECAHVPAAVTTCDKCDLIYF